MKEIMKLPKNKFVKLIILILVFLFTFILRAHDYERVPSPNHLDEQLYAWSGLYLIETGTPVSWSALNYPLSAQFFKGIVSYKGGEPSASVTLYKPWLDEPPLFSLLVGEAAHLYHAERTEFVPSSYIRIPIVIIAGLTSLVVFAIASILSGFWIGVFAMLIYGTVPIFVLGSRVAMPENVIAFLFSVSVLLLLLFERKSRLWYILPIPILAGIGGLSKPTGYFILPIAIYFVFKKLYQQKQIAKAFRYSLYLILAVLPFIGAYFWYGLHFDQSLFWLINSIQGNRPAGFASLAFFLTTPSIGTAILQDSWYIFGLVSAFFFILFNRDENKRFVAISFIYWLAIVMLSGGENDLLAWYRFPIFPMLAILLAWGIQYVYERADFFASFVAIGLLLGNRRLLVNTFRQGLVVGKYRLMFIGLLAPSAFNTIFNKGWLTKLSRVVIVLVVGTGMTINVLYLYNAFGIECESVSCPMVPTTFLSILYFPLVWRLFNYGGMLYK